MNCIGNDVLPWETKPLIKLMTSVFYTVVIGFLHFKEEKSCYCHLRLMFWLDCLQPLFFKCSDCRELLVWLRQIALIIILIKLIKAGLSLNLSDLKKVGRSAIMVSFVPACFEILGYFIFAPHLLEVTRIEATVMGAVLSAVSPVVIVPRMVTLIEGDPKQSPK